MSLVFNDVNVENVIYNGTKLDKVIYNGVTVWENWKLITTPWTLWGDFENKGSNATYDFGKTIKVKSGQFKLRTAGGRDYTPKVYLEINGSWVLIGSYSNIQDTNDVTFGDSQLREATGIRIDCSETNGGVMRYPCLVKINQYYQKGS